MSLQRTPPIAGKVLITGASGFIGGHLRTALIAGGADVVSLVRAVSPASKHGRSAPIDYADLAAVKRLIREEKPDYVFHVAGATKGVLYEDFRSANVVPTQNLMEALASEHPAVKRFLFVSSQTAYGPSNSGPPTRESDTPRPIEHYGRSKLEAEQVVQGFGDRIPWTIIRPSGVYGPADVDVFVLFKTAKSGINLFYGNRDKRISMVYVDDLIDAILAAAQSDRTRGRGYFISDGTPYTWGEFQQHIIAAIGRRAFSLNFPSFVVPAAGIAGELLTALDKKPRLFNRQKALLDAAEAWVCSIEAARTDFHYAPRTPASEGTKQAYRWYLENKWL